MNGDEATCTAYFDNPMPMDDGQGGEKIVEIGGLYHHDAGAYAGWLAQPQAARRGRLEAGL